MESLIQHAKQKFGDERAEELKPAIEQAAADIEAIQNYPIDIHDEP